MYEDIDSFIQNNSEPVETKPQTNTWNNFKKKEDKIEDPYLPIAVYCDRDFPNEIKEKLVKEISGLIFKGYTVRVNADDKQFYEAVSKFGSNKIEYYIPFKGFNDIQSKHYFNGLTSMHLAEINTAKSAWEKIPKMVKSLLARNVRMIFGDKNNSIVLALITWSKDGASNHNEVNRDTGRASFPISVASKYGFPVINIGKPGSENLLDRF